MTRSTRTSCCSTSGYPISAATNTGWGQPEDRLRAIAAGFDQHILKPVTARVLQDVLLAAERAVLERAPDITLR
jgi:CheY-like chemotaxis protein